MDNQFDLFDEEANEKIMAKPVKNQRQPKKHSVPENQPPAPEPKIILSLGAGVQSSTLAMMFSHQEFSGILPMPDVAVFADTQSEPAYVYEYLKWLTPKLAFPVVVVTKGSLRQNIIDSINGGRFAGAPFYTESDSSNGGALRRQCTKEWKVGVIEKFVREYCGLEKGQRAPKFIDTDGYKKTRLLARQYIGISMDEIVRMKPSRKAYIKNEFPLIEKRMSRQDCLDWMKDKGYPLPKKSSCTFCPYHSNATWREMKDNDPDSWNDAVEIDRLIRNGVRGTKQKLYLHNSLIPLERVDFRTATEKGQQDLFLNECEGMCGL